MECLSVALVNLYLFSFFNSYNCRRLCWSAKEKRKRKLMIELLSFLKNHLIKEPFTNKFFSFFGLIFGLERLFRTGKAATFGFWDYRFSFGSFPLFKQNSRCYSLRSDFLFSFCLSFSLIFKTFWRWYPL